MDCGVPQCILGTSVILSLGGEVLETSEHEVEPFGSFLDLFWIFFFLNHG